MTTTNLHQYQTSPSQPRVQGISMLDNSVPLSIIPPVAQTLLHVTQDKQLAIQKQLSKLWHIASSQTKTYVPPHQRKTPPDTHSNQGDFGDEQENKVPLLSSTVIHQLYRDFPATSHND